MPDQPSDVVRIEAFLDVNGETVSTGWWVFAPGSDVATAHQLNVLLGDFFFGPTTALLEILSTDTSVVLLRCVTSPANGITMELSPTANAGALDGTTALNAALVWTWLTGARRYGARTHNWLPLSRSNLGADKRRLSALGYAEGGARAKDFMFGVNSLDAPGGGLCVLVGLHRQAAGVPLGSSVMLPVQAATVSPIVGTLQRRAATARRAPAPF